MQTSPINGPPVLLQEILARRLQRAIGPQILHGQRVAGQGIPIAALQVLDQRAAVIADAVLCDNGVVHDGEGDAVDEVVGDLLENAKAVSAMWFPNIPINLLLSQTEPSSLECRERLNTE